MNLGAAILQLSNFHAHSDPNMKESISWYVYLPKTYKLTFLGLNNVFLYRVRNKPEEQVLEDISQQEKKKVIKKREEKEQKLKIVLICKDIY